MQYQQAMEEIEIAHENALAEIENTKREILHNFRKFQERRKRSPHY
jgi:vacuolar-type H+-ATPase subunit E/Vma4